VASVGGGALVFYAVASRLNIAELRLATNAFTSRLTALGRRA